MVLASPHNQAAPKAHDVVLDVDHAYLAPGLEDSVHRPAPVEVLDVRTKKPAGPPPGSATKRVTRRSHHEAGVNAPAGAPQRAWRYKEVEARQTPRGPKHSGELGEGCRGVGDVAQQIGEGDGIERLRWKRQLFGACVLEPDTAVETRVGNVFAADLQHRLADVNPDDVRLRRRRERDGHTRGPRGDVEDETRPEARDMMHQLAAPMGVQAQRKNLRQAVVLSRQILEETRRKGILRARVRRASGLC